MKQLLRDVEHNFTRFSEHWPRELREVSSALQVHKEAYLHSYRRLVSLQAWRHELLQERLSTDSFGFFAEAHNDALVSHVLAQLGSWRSALKALRSCLENIGFCLYYMDHPVELQIWQLGRHVMNFASILDYLQRHPSLNGVPTTLSGLDVMKREYSTLSRAVHGSGATFRMTDDGKGVRLWFADKARVGSWLVREAHVVTSVNLVLSAIFRSDLAGTKKANLRKAISLAVPEGRHAEIRTRLGISLFAP